MVCHHGGRESEEYCDGSRASVIEPHGPPEDDENGLVPQVENVRHTANVRQRLGAEPVVGEPHPFWPRHRTSCDESQRGECGARRPERRVARRGSRECRPREIEEDSVERRMQVWHGAALAEENRVGGDQVLKVLESCAREQLPKAAWHRVECEPLLRVVAPTEPRQAE